MKNVMKLVFYRNRVDLPEGAVCLNVKNFKKILHRFDRGELKILYVPVSMITGWRSTQSSGDVDVEFLGSGWTREEKNQALYRLRPAKCGDTPPPYQSGGAMPRGLRILDRILDL